MIKVYDEGFDTAEVKGVPEKVFETVLKVFNEKDLAVELTLTDEETIRQVNAEARGVDKITDVLSFPTLDKPTFPIDRKKFAFDLDPETGELMIGEILICVKRCREQGEEYGHGFLREYAYLITHGLLHLLGYDHIEDPDRALMREKEEEVLSLLNIVR